MIGRLTLSWGVLTKTHKAMYLGTKQTDGIVWEGVAQ